MLKAVVMLVVGSLLLVGAAASGLAVRRFIQESSVADGQVASLNAGGAHPQIEFTSADGQKVSYPEGGWIGGYKPGDHVRVRYRPNAPRMTATLDSFGALWFWPILLALLALGGLWAGWSELPSGKGETIDAI